MFKDLGQRICIIGPPFSGKSTLAQALAQKLGCDTYHLDQFVFKPHSNWQIRLHEDFVKDHDSLIQEESWIIEGSFRSTFPKRLERATSVIWLELPVWGCLWRYIIRCFKSKSFRIGHVIGAPNYLNIGMIHYILLDYSSNRTVFKQMLKNNPCVIKISSWNELKHLYKKYNLI